MTPTTTPTTTPTAVAPAPTATTNILPYAIGAVLGIIAGKALLG